MSLPIFQAYIDYCKQNSVIPNVHGLNQWKKKYNNR